MSFIQGTLTRTTKFIVFHQSFNLSSYRAFDFEFSREEWFQLIRVSSILDIQTLHDVMTKKALGHCTPSELLDYGRLYKVTECVSAGLRAFCLRRDHLSLEEGKVLGMEAVVEIARVREMLARGVPWNQADIKIMW